MTMRVLMAPKEIIMKILMPLIHREMARLNQLKRFYISGGSKRLLRV